MDGAALIETAVLSIELRGLEGMDDGRCLKEEGGEGAAEMRGEVLVGKATAIDPQIKKPREHRGF